MRRALVLGIYATLVLALLPLTFVLGPIRVYTMDVALVPTLIIAAAAGCFRLGRVTRATSVDLLLVTFLVGALLTTLTSYYPPNSINRFLIWARVIVVYAIVRSLTATGALTLRELWKLWPWCLCFLILVGLIEAHGADKTVLVVSRYFGENRDERMTFLDQIRISGTARDANTYGDWLVLFAIGTTWRAMAYSHHLRKAKIVAVNLLTLFTMYFTLSRGALAFVVVGWAITLLAILRVRAKSAISAVSMWTLASTIGAAVVVIGAQYFFSRIAYSDLYRRATIVEDVGRLALLKYGWMLLQRPKVLLLGTGLGAFFPALVKLGYGYSAFDPWNDLSTVAWGIHNSFAEILVEAGVPMFVCFVAVWVAVIKRGVRASKVYRAGDLGLFGSAVWVTFVAFALMPMQVHTSPTDPEILVFLMAMAGALVGMTDGGTHPVGSKKEPRWNGELPVATPVQA